MEASHAVMHEGTKHHVISRVIADFVVRITYYCPHHKRMIFTDSLRILIKEDSQALVKAQAVPLDPLVLVEESQQM